LISHSAVAFQWLIQGLFKENNPILLLTTLSLSITKLLTEIERVTVVLMYRTREPATTELGALSATDRRPLQLQ
jgi:hypothetical protein